MTEIEAPTHVLRLLEAASTDPAARTAARAYAIAVKYTDRPLARYIFRILAALPRPPRMEVPWW